MNILVQQQADDKGVELLLDLAFGLNRFEKAAYLYRQDISALKELSFVIYEDDLMIATLRFWPVNVGDKDCLLLGPIAVLPELQGKGYGIALMEHGLKRAKELGHSRVILVGDEAYYGRLGFTREHARALHMPGQEDESRLLALELQGGAFDGVSGEILKSQL